MNTQPLPARFRALPVQRRYDIPGQPWMREYMWRVGNHRYRAAWLLDDEQSLPQEGLNAALHRFWRMLGAA